MKVDFTASQKKRKVFILGATGFIGFAVTKRLVALGFKNLYCLYRKENKKEAMFRDVDTSSITFLRGDVSQPDVLRRGLEGTDVVFNASGLATDWGIKQEVWAVNVEGPETIVKMLEESKASTHYIHVSTASIYGFGSEEKTETSPLLVDDRFYTASKVELHTWLREEMKKGHGFPITILAPSIVWGPGDQIYIPTFKTRLKNKQLFYIGKDQKIDFVHIDDLVDAALLCFFNERAYNKEYIINGSEPFTFRAYIDKIAEFSELPPPSLRMPIPVVMAIGFVMECSASLINLVWPHSRPLITRFQVHILTAPFRVSTTRAKSDLGYAPEITFSKGIDGLREYISRCDWTGIDAT